MRFFQFLLIFCFFSFSVFSQEDLLTKKSFYKMQPSIGVNLSMPVFLGENLLANDYIMNPGVGLNFQIGVVNRLGVGLFMSSATGQIGESRILGDFFDRSRWNSGGIYIPYAIPIGDKFIIEPSMGIAGSVMTNFDGSNKFRLNYHRFFLSTSFKYAIHQFEHKDRILIVLGSDLSRIYGPRIQINQQDRRYVQNAGLLTFNFGFVYEIY